MRKTGVRYIAVPLATVALATALGGGTPSVATAAEAQTAPAATTQAATAPATTDEAAAETPKAADTDATTAAATTDAATTAEAQQQPTTPDNQDKVVATLTRANGTVNSYDSIEAAVKGANWWGGSQGDNKAATLTFTQSVTDYQRLDFKSPVNITADKDVTFSGTLVIEKSAAGSTIKGVHFQRLDGREGNFASIELKNVADVEVSGNKFDSPSALGKVSEWQYNGVWVDGSSSNITVSGNTFNLGRMNDTNGSGDAAQDSNANSGINLGGGVDGEGNALIQDVEVSGNTVNVTAPDAAATRDASVNLLVANGNGQEGQFGVKNLKVTGNTYDASADENNNNTRVAAISGVDGFKFSGNTVDAMNTVTQSIWNGNTTSSKNVVAYGNTYKGSASPLSEYSVTVAPDNKVVYVQEADGDLSQLASLKDAEGVANQIDGATVTLKKSVTDHSSVTFKKKVALTADEGVTFNGVVRLNGNETTVQGVHFILDGGKAPSGNPIYQSLIISGADNVTVSGSVFDLKDAASSGQLSSLWLEGSTDGTNISGNTFNIGRGKDSSVGINLVGGNITNTTVEGNTVKLQNNGDAQSSAMGLVANGNQQNNGKFGVTNLTVKNNTIDGSEVPSNKGYGVSIANVDGLTLEGNTIENLYMGLSYSTWGSTRTSDGAAYTKLPVSSKNVTISGNTISNTTAPVYFKATFDNGLRGRWDVNVVPATEVHFTDVQTIKVDDLSNWRGDAAIKSPIVSTVAFVGWYKDAGFTQKVSTSDNSGVAYAKYVPVSDLIKFRGGQLRMDNYVNADGTKDYSQADLRLVYDFVVPEGAEYNQQQSGWNYGYEGEGDLSQATSVQRKTINPDGSIHANIVLNKVNASDYKNLTFYARANYAYTTFDGTPVRVFDTEVPYQGLKGEYGKRTVDFIARNTLTDPKATDEEKAYAQGIIDAEK